MIIQGLARERPATAWSRSDNDFFSAGITPGCQRLLSASSAADVPRSGPKPRKGIRCKPPRQRKAGLIGGLLECLHRYWNE
jgi:hypothetical protein